MSKRSLIADFYMFEFLCQYNELKNDDLDMELKSQAEDFLYRFKEELLSILEYVIIAEVSHMWWESNARDMGYSIPFVHDDANVVLQEFLPQFCENLPPLKTEGILKDVERGWALACVQKSELQTGEFIQHVKKIWNKLQWRPEFGGPIFADLSNEYFRLLHSYGMKLFVQIDRILDLEHNTGSIFKKIPAYAIDGKHDWIKEFLDMKRDLRDPWELYEYTKESTKIAAKKLKELKFGTREDFKMSNKKLSELSAEAKNDMLKEFADTDIAISMKETADKYMSISEPISLLPAKLNEAMETIDAKLSSNDQRVRLLAKHMTDLVSVQIELFEGITNALDTNNQVFKDINLDMVKQIDINSMNILTELNKASEHLSAQIKANRVHIEKHANDLQNETIKHVDHIPDVNDKIFVLFLERLDDIEKLATPWYIKFINSIKSLFNK